MAPRSEKTLAITCAATATAFIAVMFLDGTDVFAQELSSDTPESDDLWDFQNFANASTPNEATFGESKVEFLSIHKPPTMYTYEIGKSETDEFSIGSTYVSEETNVIDAASNFVDQQTDRARGIGNFNWNVDPEAGRETVELNFGTNEKNGTLELRWKRDGNEVDLNARAGIECGPDVGDDQNIECEGGVRFKATW